MYESKISKIINKLINICVDVMEKNYYLKNIKYT